MILRLVLAVVLALSLTSPLAAQTPKERFDKRAMTAAHRTLPFNTRVRVTNLRNGLSVIVRITDRGPYGRAIIDLSEAAAEKLDMIEAGVVPVKIERL